MIRNKHSNKTRPMALWLWLSAIDPGLMRFQAAGRSALALLSIWLVIRIAMQLLTGGNGPPIPLFGVLSGIVFLLFIIDLRPSDRLISLWLAPIPFAGAVILASFLSDYFWLNNLILLFLFFFAYFFRRYGARAGELALVTTVGFYMGFLLHPPLQLYPLFLASVLASALVVTLWLFVFIPYDPVKSLLRSVTAFYQNVAGTVVIIREGLESAGANTAYQKKLQRRFRQAHLNRRAIEGLFSATVSPAIWSQTRLNRLQEEMFKTERGLEQLIEAAIQLSAELDKMPDELRHTLIEGLSALENQLWELASGEGQARLTEIGSTLQSQLKSSLGDELSGEWAYSLLRMGLAARQLAHSVAGIQMIKIAWNERTTGKSPGISPVSPQATQIMRPAQKPKVTMHPTTILGFQAVLATGLSMLAAYLLDLDQPNLVYWTAFVVIAGSTGESLRRMAMRIIGVIAGTVVGVFLAVVLPDALPLVVLSVTVSFFLTIYAITVSYAWMVFWLNIAVMLVITAIGGAALELLVLRPVSTLLGAAIAALVVVFVLPIHAQNRFIAALSEFLRAVDRYIAAYVSTLVDASSTGDLKAEELNIDTSYKKLELSLPAITYEYNPLSRAQNRLANQSTSLAVLRSYVTHLNEDIGGDPGSLANAKDKEFVTDIQSRIHQAIDALSEFLAERQGGEVQPLAASSGGTRQEIVIEEILSAEADSVEVLRNRALYHLTRINDTILQISSGLGAPVVSQ